MCYKHFSSLKIYLALRSSIISSHHRVEKNESMEREGDEIEMCLLAENKPCPPISSNTHSSRKKKEKKFFQAST